MGKDITKDKLMEDLRVLTQDAEELLKQLADGVGNKTKAKVGALVEGAKGSYWKFNEKAREGARRTDVAIHDHPYHSMGVAFGIGLLIGILCSRR